MLPGIMKIGMDGKNFQGLDNKVCFFFNLPNQARTDVFVIFQIPAGDTP